MKTRALPKRRGGRDIKGRAVGKRKSPRTPLGPAELASQVERCLAFATQYTAQRHFELAYAHIMRGGGILRRLDPPEALRERIREGYRSANALQLMYRPELLYRISFEAAWFKYSGIALEDAIKVMNLAAREFSASIDSETGDEGDQSFGADVLRSMKLTSRTIRARGGDDFIAQRVRWIAHEVEGTRENFEEQRYAMLQLRERGVLGRDDVVVMPPDQCAAFALAQLKTADDFTERQRRGVLESAKQDRESPELVHAWLELRDVLVEMREFFEEQREVWERVEKAA